MAKSLTKKELQRKAKMMSEFIKTLTGENTLAIFILKRDEKGAVGMHYHTCMNKKERNMVGEFMTENLIEVVGEDFIVKTMQEEIERMEKAGTLKIPKMQQKNAMYL